MKFFVQVIQEGYVCQLRTGGNILVDVCIGEPSASYVTEDVTTIALHRKCPISPDWTHSFDSRRNMQQCMDGEGTRSYAQRIVFVV
jgi:acyl carrier protein phosphodiesterase